MPARQNKSERSDIPAETQNGTHGRDRKEVQQLIDLGKAKGFLTYEEVNDALPVAVRAMVTEPGLVASERPVRLVALPTVVTSSVRLSTSVSFASSAHSGIVKLTPLAKFVMTASLSATSERCSPPSRRVVERWAGGHSDGGGCRSDGDCGDSHARQAGRVAGPWGSPGHR